MACLVVLASSAVALFRPLPKLGLGTRKRVFWGFGLAMGLLIVTAIVIPAPSHDKNASPARKASASGTVAGSDDQIAEVQAYRETKHASVKVDLSQGWSGKDLPVQIGMVVESAGKAIKRGAPDLPAGIETVAFWFTAPTTDAYGTDTRSKVAEFTVRSDDLKNVRYDKVVPQGMLEFAYDLEVKPAAREPIAEYCAENRQSNPRFCAAAKD